MARKEKKYHFIYKTTNMLNNKYYYGMHSTDNLDDGYLGSGKRLRRSINKHGKENHKREIIEYCTDKTSLKNRETEIINLNEIAKKDCMNLMIGGSGGAQSLEKQRNWILAGSKGFTDRIKNDSKFKEEISKHLLSHVKECHKLGKIKYDNFTNKKHSDETKKKMSLKASERVGSKISQLGSMWITDGVNNKKIKKDGKRAEMLIGSFKYYIIFAKTNLC